MGPPTWETRGGGTQWIGRLTHYQSVASLNLIKGSHCFLEQETLSSLFSTDWFQERIREQQANSEKIHIPCRNNNSNKQNKEFISFYCLLSATCLIIQFIFVCMGFNAISKVVILLRIYLGAITSAFLSSLQATDSFPTWSVVGGKWLHNVPLVNFL